MTTEPVMTEAAATGTATGTGRPTAGRGYFPALLAASTTLWALLLGPVLTTIPAQVDRLAPDDKVFALALVTGIGGLVGILTNPVIGHLSDTTRSRLGRRRPWLLAGVPVVGTVLSTV